jgi:hypothetical protein
MDFESERSRKLGCWHAPDLLSSSIEEAFSSDSPTPDFVPSRELLNFTIDSGFGKDCPDDVREFWLKEIAKNYRGDEGRKRIKMASINLRDRDGLHGRAEYVVCPVLWLHVSISFYCPCRLDRGRN